MHLHTGGGSSQHPHTWINFGCPALLMPRVWLLHYHYRDIINCISYIVFVTEARDVIEYRNGDQTI
jgi:hypothetical protein